MKERVAEPPAIQERSEREPRARSVVNREILLVRHTAVALHWSRRCYGQTDIGLSRAGRRHALELASAQLGSYPITAIVHSGLKRTSYLANALAELTAVTPCADARWQERNFGTWEGRSWHAIWKETGSAMDGMLLDPNRYRPGGGETTSELIARSVAAWNALPRHGCIVVVTHGGPIAAVRATLDRAPIAQILDYRVSIGAITAVRSDGESLNALSPALPAFARQMLNIGR